MTRWPSSESPIPTVHSPKWGWGRGETRRGGAVGPRPQLHTKPFTFSLPPKLLPGLRFFPRVSDAPFGGRRDGLTASPNAASSLAT